MLEKEKINGTQFMRLVCQYTIGSSILIAPSGLAGEAKQDAWIASVFGVGIGLILVILYMNIGKRYPGMTFVQICEKLLGKWIGKVVSMFFFSFSFLLASLVLRNIGDFMTTQMLAKTPLPFILILFLFIVIIGARLGIEAIARTSEMLFPWTIIPFVLLIIMLFPELEIKNILPIFEGGIKPILRASIPLIGVPFLELIVFLMIFPSVNQTKEATEGFIKGALIGGAVIVTVTMVSILVLGHSVTALATYSTYVLGKKVSIGSFFERIEALVAMIWVITIYFKLVILFYASAIGMAQILGLKEYRPLLFPLGMIAIVLAIVAYPNISYFQNFIAVIWTPYALTYGFLLPLVLLLVSAFQNRKR